MNDITHFYINDNYINRNYYLGKTEEYFINNDLYNIPIKDLFIINTFDNLEIAIIFKIEETKFLFKFYEIYYKYYFKNIIFFNTHIYDYKKY